MTYSCGDICCSTKLILGVAKNLELGPHKNPSQLNLSLSTTDKESQHPIALTPGGSFSPVVKQFLNSVMTPSRKTGHRRNHSGGSLRHVIPHNRAITRGGSLDQVDTSQVLVDIEQLNLLSTEDGVTESQSELDSLQRRQLVNLDVSDSEMDGMTTAEVTVTSSHNDALHEDSSSVDLLETVSSQGEEGDDEEDYQPSSDPAVPETPTGNEDYSSSSSSTDISYTVHPDPSLPAAVNILNNKGNLSLLKCYFDSPLSKKAPGELDDSGFHVSTILIIFNKIFYHVILQTPLMNTPQIDNPTTVL